MSLGLFLTPGASRTAYQVGAVHALVAEVGLRFEVIGASSVGAMNGAFVAMDDTATLADIWAGWHTHEVFRPDWGAIVRGGLFWSSHLADNSPQRRRAIDPHLAEDRLRDGVTFGFNLTNMTDGVDEYVRFPDDDPAVPLGLRAAVDASVAIPGLTRLPRAGGRQWADGLVADGFPLEELVLRSGVRTAFVVGVAPRDVIDDDPVGPIATFTRAFDWNQYTETRAGLDRAAWINDRLSAWDEDRAAVRAIVEEEIADPDERRRALAEIDTVYAQGPDYGRGVVEIISVLPGSVIERPEFTFDPEGSRELMEQGRRDALAAYAAR